MSEILGKINSRGFWKVVIRPTRFKKERIRDPEALYPILQKATVSLRGWNFPHLDSRTEPRIGSDWIGQQTNWQQYKEWWRFFRSGQFIHISGIPFDWRDESNIWGPYEGWKPGALIGVADALFTFIEIFELAARLSLSEAGNLRTFIGVTVGNIKGRELYSEYPRRFLPRGYAAKRNEFKAIREMPKAELISMPRETALQLTAEFFRVFEWSAGIELLREWMDEGLR